MEALAQLETERGNPEYIAENLKSSSISKQQPSFSGGRARTASREMCTFLILNISSLRLVPVNMIVYRQQYGSVNPTAVIAPAIVTTFFSTLVAVIFCKMMNRKQRV